MSMPTFPARCSVPNGDEAVNAVLTSIALEETALSHILNAEGEKIQYALSHALRGGCADLKTVLEVNESASRMLEQVADIQLTLLHKLGKLLRRPPPRGSGQPNPPRTRVPDACPKPKP